MIQKMIDTSETFLNSTYAIKFLSLILNKKPTKKEDGYFRQNCLEKCVPNKLARLGFLVN